VKDDLSGMRNHLSSAQGASPSEQAATASQQKLEGQPRPGNRRRGSIRLRLVSLVVASVLPVWIAAGLLVYYNYQSRRPLTEQRMLETARALTMVVDRELANMQAGLSVLATSPSLVSGDLPAFYRQARVILEAHPGDDILLADATGQELVNTLLPFGVPLPKRGVPDAVRQVYATGRPLITNVFKGAVTGRVLISVDVPVFRDGRVVYDLAMTVSPDRFATVLLQQHLPPEWVGTIVDNDHVVVARTHLPEKLVGHLSGPVLLQRMVAAAEGTVELNNLEGIRVFDSFSRSATSGWTVVIGVPKAIMMAEIWRWLWWIVAGTALLSITGITVAVLLGRSIARSSARDAELAAIMDVVPAVTFITRDPECQRITSNRAGYDLLRLPPGANTSRSAPDSEGPSNYRFLRDGRELTPGELPVQLAATGREVRDCEYTIAFDDGSSRSVFGNAVPLLDDRGGVRGAVGAFIDITERKRVEQESVAAKELAEKTVAQFRANIDSMSEGMYVIGTDGKRLLTNPAYFRIHGFDPAPSEEFVSSISALLERYDLNGRLLSPEEWPVSCALRGETVLQSQQRVRRIDTGKEVILSVNAVPVRDTAGNVTLAVVTIEDITTQKQSEAALIRSEKLASVGRMAATIAHEINNPLEAVTNALYIAKCDRDLSETTRQYLDIADAELRRVAYITRRSLGFYRESNVPALTSVNAVLESAVDLLKGKINAKSAVIEKQWGEPVWIMAVGGELRQVFSNLVANSLDAIDNQGTIKLRVSNAPSITNGRRRVRVTVADNGKGITPSALAHIFEPFFTTKGSYGTGLGLWVSKQIIKKHGGSIRVRSSSNRARRGTVFSVILPVDPEAAASSQSAGA
jgi:signal transduction histidine kinase